MNTTTVNFNFTLKDADGSDLVRKYKDENGKDQEKVFSSTEQFAKALLNDNFNEGTPAKKWILVQKVSCLKEVEIDRSDLDLLKKAVAYVRKVIDENGIENEISVLPMAFRGQLEIFLSGISFDLETKKAASKP